MLRTRLLRLSFHGATHCLPSSFQVSFGKFCRFTGVIELSVSCCQFPTPRHQRFAVAQARRTFVFGVDLFFPQARVAISFGVIWGTPSFGPKFGTQCSNVRCHVCFVRVIFSRERRSQEMS